MTENRKQQSASRTSEKGFTLIELAIVLVIIGIILGAVLKGQDLITNARTKKLVQTVKQWEIITWTLYDRTGHFPGASSTGLINSSPYADIVTNGHFTDAPSTNSFSLGADTFYVLWGSDGTKNLMAICKDSACGTTFSDSQLAYADALDTAIDGSSSGTAGRVVGATTAFTGSASTWLITSTSFTPTSASYSTSTTAILYYFDKKP